MKGFIFALTAMVGLAVMMNAEALASDCHNCNQQFRSAQLDHSYDSSEFRIRSARQPTYEYETVEFVRRPVQRVERVEYVESYNDVERVRRRVVNDHHDVQEVRRVVVEKERARREPLLRRRGSSRETSRQVIRRSSSDY